MPNRDERIRALLQARLAEAGEAHRTASLEFAFFIRDIPSALPPPDGAQRIKNAGAKVHDAHDQMIEALLALRQWDHRRIASPEIMALAGE